MTRARDVANVLSTATALATDAETAAAISSHNSASDPHGDRANAATLYAPLSNPTFSRIGGDEGGQINFANAATNTTLSGNISLDIYQNRIRLFESGGNNRGAYVDLSTLSNGVGSELIAAAPQSGNSGKYLTTNGTAASWSTISAGSMTQLATASFGGSAISFQNISQDYKSLVIFVNNAVSAYRFNNETGTNYINLIADTRTQAAGSAVITQYYQPDLSFILGNYYTGSNDNVGAQQYIEIPNYASTTCRKIARSAAMGNNGTYWWFNQLWGGRTNSNDAVSRIDLINTPTNGSATLFGVK